MRHYRALVAAIGVGFCAVVAGVSATAAGASVFAYTGAEQVWPVPAGVTAVRVVAIGAPGGGSGGGAGAIVTADVPVPDGVANLYVEVGGPGGVPTGGFNGGGNGGVSTTNGNDGGGGGGATDIRTCSTAAGVTCPTAVDSLHSRLVAAAGGGGASKDFGGGPAGGVGGGAGGGQPGTQTSGGPNGQNVDCSSGPGGGVFGFGAGGLVDTEPLDAGGGGGGGWYGGGGGAGAGVMGCGSSGGGGGGSSYVAGQPAPPLSLAQGTAPQLTITAPVPVASSRPAISGDLVVGDSLSERAASWTNTVTTITRQWLRCAAAGTGCTAIPGATGQTYALTPADAGGTIAVQEIASNVYGATAEPSTSPPTSVIQAAPPPTASVSVRSTVGPAAFVQIGCTGLADQICTGVLSGVAQERALGRTIVGVTARKGKVHKPTIKSVAVVNDVPFSVGGGRAATIEIYLNRAGKHLLAEFYELRTSLALSDTQTLGLVTFDYPRITSLVLYGVSIVGAETKFTSLTVSGLPRSALITLTCHGGGCPFTKRHLAPHGSSDNLTHLLADSRLRAGTRVVLTITAPDRVGKVLDVTLRPQGPKQVKLCLPPTVSAPVPCAS
jgi:hypothetical protein